MRHPSLAAFSLVEVTIALGIAAFALAAIIGLLPIGLTSIRAGTDQMAATGILSALESDLRAANAGDAKTRMYEVDLSQVGMQGTVASPIYLNWEGTHVAEARNAAFRLFVEILSNESGQPLRGRGKVTWPAGAPIREDGGAERSRGSVETYFAIPAR